MKKLFFTFSFLAFNLTAFAKTEVSLALNWKPEPQFGGFYQAQLLQNSNKTSAFSLKIIEGGSGTPTIQMLANHKVDFAVVSSEEILINNDHNPKNPVVALFAVYQTNPQILMCHSQKNFKGINEILHSNVTLAMQSGLSYAQFLKKKYPQAKAKIVPYLGGIANFTHDENFCQQGFLTSEPLLVKKAGVQAQAYLIANEGFNPYTTVVATHLETLQKQPQLVQTVVELTRSGWTEYLKNPEPANKVMQKLNKAMDSQTFTDSAQAQVELIETAETKKHGLGQMSIERWSTLAQQLKDLGLIQKLPDLAQSFKN